MTKEGSAVRPAGDCATMAEVRAGIDAVDAALVALLARRAGYIDRAAALKLQNGWPARITPRVEAVVANMRGHAAAGGLPPDLVDGLLEPFWRHLIDWSIAREEAVLGPDTTGDAAGDGAGEAQDGVRQDGVRQDGVQGVRSGTGPGPEGGHDDGTGGG